MRARPDELTIFDFGDEFHVVCPRCGGQALVQDRGVVEQRADRAGRVVLTCAHCGLTRTWTQAGPGVLTSADTGAYPEGVAALGGPVDWYFHLPLWLQAPCCGATLWAYNARHLAFLDEAVRAWLRGHARGVPGWRNQALRNRLPKSRSVLAAKNRDDVLRCIVRLREKLPA
jgi:hypothetical protein